MSNIQEHFSKLALNVPEILLPAPHVNLEKWAVVACDQFTSEKEYWQKVDEYVGDAPSTLRLIFPECYLEDTDKEERIKNIQSSMRKYIEKEILKEQERGFILVKRDTAHSRTRYGLLVALDLEHYDFTKGAKTLIRATERTILERIPPRKAIREGAPVELPHIMVLIDDPDKTVIEPLVGKKEELKKVYDFDLMMGSGHVTGYMITEPSLLENIAGALEKLADKRRFKERYGTEDVFLYAIGDGNHSLATAKVVWEDLKKEHSQDPGIMEHPARWALVELVNLYDTGLNFEPIHRVVFNIDYADFFHQLEAGRDFDKIEYFDNPRDMLKEIERKDDTHSIGFMAEDKYGALISENPSSPLPTPTIQNFLDSYKSSHTNISIDYIHGEEATMKLASKPGNMGFFLPALDKSKLFKTVMVDGALPRKTFSMGEADEKRFYVEARKIVP